MLNTVIVLILLKQIGQKVRRKSGHKLCSVIRGNKLETWQKMWVCIYSWDRASCSQLDWSCWAWSLQQLDFRTRHWPGSQGLPGPEPALAAAPQEGQDPCRGRADPWRELLPTLVAFKATACTVWDVLPNLQEWNRSWDPEAKYNTGERPPARKMWL